MGMYGPIPLAMDRRRPRAHVVLSVSGDELMHPNDHQSRVRLLQKPGLE